MKKGTRGFYTFAPFSPLLKKMPLLQYCHCHTIVAVKPLVAVAAVTCFDLCFAAGGPFPFPHTSNGRCPLHRCTITLITCATSLNSSSYLSAESALSIFKTAVFSDVLPCESPSFEWREIEEGKRKKQTHTYETANPRMQGRGKRGRRVL